MQTCRQSGMMNSVFFAQQREQPSGCPEASRESACARPRAIARVERRHHSDITPDVSPYALVLSHLEFHCLSVLVFHVHPLLAEYPARLDMCCLFLCPTRPPPGGRPLSVIHEKPRPRARGRQGTIDAREGGGESAPTDSSKCPCVSWPSRICANPSCSGLLSLQPICPAAA